MEEKKKERKQGEGLIRTCFLARVLQYLETPQYLRKALFPMHRDLRLAGLMPPLDCPHHLRFEDQSEFREGLRWRHRTGHVVAPREGCTSTLV